MNPIAVLIFATCCIELSQALAVSSGQSKHDKVFNYVGPMPLKDERIEDNTKNEPNVTSAETTTTMSLSEQEAVCWEVIVEQSTVTFAMQEKVLKELDSDWDKINADPELREAITKITKRMRNSMNQALEALKKGSAEEFFDALFESSEEIVRMSSLIRDPKLDENVFLVLVKTVSRLGRNNSALIQDFTDRCSFALRSPRPRNLSSD